MKSLLITLVLLAVFQASYATEQQQGCVILFSECNYGGQSYQVCGSNPTVAPALKNFIVKSVQVPQGTTITFYGEQNFVNQHLVATGSIACLSTPIHLSFLQLRGAYSSSAQTINSFKINS